MSADPSSSGGLPGRSRPVLSDLSKETTEEDLWNLDDDSTGTTLPSPPPPRSKVSTPQAQVVEEADSESEAAPEGRSRHSSPSSKNRPTVIEPADRAPAKPRTAKLEPERAKLGDTFDDLDEEDGGTSGWNAAGAEEADEPVTYINLDEESEIPEPEAQPGAEHGRRLKISKRELLGLGIFALVLLMVGVWGVISFSGLIQSKKDREVPKFPVAGKYATLAKQETFWREPILDGPDRDRVQHGVAIIPGIDLTLSDKSSAGALRVIFRDDKGRPVGDSVTRAFKAGRFDATSAPLATFISTAGFEQMGTFNGYVAGTSEPWSVRIMEGPSADAPPDQFQTLADIPVSAFRR